MTTLPAIVLAGAPAAPEARSTYGIQYRAEIPFAGKTMLQRVVDALATASTVREILIVGDTHCALVGQVVPPVGSFFENLVAGLVAYKSETRVLVATSDIPMLTPEAVDDFVQRCEPLNADFYYPIVRKENCEKTFSGMRRTYVRLAEGTFTGGNVVILNPPFVIQNTSLITHVLNARKNPFKLAKIIGIRIFARALVAMTVCPSALDIQLIEQTVGRVLQATVKAIESPYAEIATDIDDDSQLSFAEAEFIRRERLFS